MRFTICRDEEGYGWWQVSAGDNAQDTHRPPGLTDEEWRAVWAIRLKHGHTVAKSWLDSVYSFEIEVGENGEASVVIVTKEEL